MIDIKNLSLAINGRPILRDITTAMGDGEIIGIIGKTGAGKTMFLKAIAGQVGRQTGTISFRDLPAATGPRSERNMVTYYSSAAPRNLDETLFNFLLLSRIPYKKFLRPFSAYDRQVAEEYMALFNLETYSEDTLRILPDGIFKRAVLAHVLIREPYAVLLDNPTNDLDIVSLKLLQKALKRYVTDGDRIAVVCSNDVNFIAQTADTLLVMNSGKIVKAGNADILDSDLIKNYFGIEAIITRNVYTGKPEVHFFPDA
jgi:iron complex transport system ATP-binding protein